MKVHEYFTITEKAPTMAFMRLKKPISAFPSITLLYRSLNMISRCEIGMLVQRA